jgi:hypothetical protein
MTTLKQLVIEVRALLVAPTTNIKKVNFLVDRCLSKGYNNKVRLSFWMYLDK